MAEYVSYLHNQNTAATIMFQIVGLERRKVAIKSPRNMGMRTARGNNVPPNSLHGYGGYTFRKEHI